MPIDPPTPKAPGGRILGMPAWLVVAVVVGAVVVAAAIRRRRRAAADAAANDAGLAALGSPPGAGASGGVGDVGSGGNTNPATAGGFTTVSAWEAAALSRLNGQYDAAAIIAALGHWINGDPLSSQDLAIINAAIGAVGPPPGLSTIPVPTLGIPVSAPGTTGPAAATPQPAPAQSSAAPAVATAAPVASDPVSAAIRSVLFPGTIASPAVAAQESIPAVIASPGGYQFTNIPGLNPSEQRGGETLSVSPAGIVEHTRTTPYEAGIDYPTPGMTVQALNAARAQRGLKPL